MSEEATLTENKTCEGACSGTADPPVDLSLVDAMVSRIGKEARHLIPLLQAIQKKWNYLPAQALERLAEITEITPDAITGVSTFYSQFRHHPVGKHIVKTCVGTACHVSGASVLDDTFRSHLKVPEGEHTSPDKAFTVEEVACLGCCMLAPVVQVDETIYGDVEAFNIPNLLNDFLAAEQAKSGDGEEVEDTRTNVVGEVRICVCSSCTAGGSFKVYEELRKVVSDMNLPVKVKKVGCKGASFETPLIEISVLQPGSPSLRLGQSHRCPWSVIETFPAGKLAPPNRGDGIPTYWKICLLTKIGIRQRAFPRMFARKSTFGLRGRKCAA